MPPFSCASYGVQNSLWKRQCERKAMKRVVSSRRNPRRIFLHRGFQVVVPQQPKDAAKKPGCVLMGFEEGLLGRPLIGAVESCSTRHAAHRKHLQPHWLAAQLRPRL